MSSTGFSSISRISCTYVTGATLDWKKLCSLQKKGACASWITLKKSRTDTALSAGKHQAFGYSSDTARAAVLDGASHRARGSLTAAFAARLSGLILWPCGMTLILFRSGRLGQVRCACGRARRRQGNPDAEHADPVYGARLQSAFPSLKPARDRERCSKPRGAALSPECEAG